MSTEENRTQGRPREFDRDLALRQAMDVFWINGYQDTSLAQLTQAMNINAPSLYAVFGNKEKLFERALALYTETEGRSALRALENEHTGKAAIRSMMRDNVTLFTSFPRPRSCLIILGTVSVPLGNSVLQGVVRAYRMHILQSVRKRLRISVKARELSSGANLTVIANLCLTVLNGLSIQVLDGVPRSTLFRSIDVFVDSLGFTERSPGKRAVRSSK